MPRYLLSVHTVAGEVRQPMTDEEMQQSWKQLGILEKEMRSTGAWVFSGRLHDPDTATVVHISGGEVATTDGPFVEAKEHLGGFYIIQAEDLDAALTWASKVTAAIKVPIEVRPFADFADEPEPDSVGDLEVQPSSTRPRSAGSSARSPADRWPP